MSTEVSTELALPEGQTGIAPNVTDAAFAGLASSSKFLPRMQLMAASSKPVTEGKIGLAHYAIVSGQSVEDLTKEVRAYVVSMRLKAMDVGSDPVVAYFDPTSPEFLKIQERAEVEKEGPLAGPEFLLYLPIEKRFVTFFMCSKTMRREAPAVRALLRKLATFKSTMIRTKKYTWPGPVVTLCSTPLPGPDKELLDKVTHSFNNPPKSEIEEVDEKEKAATQGQER